MKKNYKKQINKDLRIKKKSLKEKEMNYMSNRKDMIIHLIAGLIKKKLNWMKFSCIKMSQYLRKPYEPFGGDINVKVVAKSDIKNISYVILKVLH